MTHKCVSNTTIIGSDNGSSHDRRQAMICANAGIVFIESLRTSFSEILVEIHTISFKKIRWKRSSAKWRTCCLCLNVLTSMYIPLICVCQIPSERPQHEARIKSAYSSFGLGNQVISVIWQRRRNSRYINAIKRKTIQQDSTQGNFKTWKQEENFKPYRGNIAKKTWKKIKKKYTHKNNGTI